ncbi:Uncharacterised protein [Vibrio cholerae]|nr:Uncharacterised protein [Vibrio cholerae]
MAHKRSAPKLAALLFSAWLISLRYPSTKKNVDQDRHVFFTDLLRQ